MSETLTKFGTSFQSKIIASLLSDKKFIQTISDILALKLMSAIFLFICIIFALYLEFFAPYKLIIFSLSFLEKKM